MPKILICGNDNTRESLKAILGDLYNLILTEDSKQCLECLRNAIDITILFIDLSVGEEMIHQIKEKYPKLKVIAIADKKSSKPLKELQSIGFSGQVTKPFRPEPVLAFL
jgi:DNA-binding NtrC family response regulator